MDSWVEVLPVVPFVPNSGAKPEWAYFPNGPPTPPAATPNTNHVTKTSPGIFFIRDILNSPTQPDQEAAPMCWTLSPPPPGWTPPTPPPIATVADVSPRAPASPPPAAEKSSPPPAAIVQFPNAPSIKCWTLVLPPIGGWNTATTPSPNAGN